MHEITCPTCEGTGKSKLSHEFEKTLSVIRKFPSLGSTAEYVADVLVTKHTTQNARLERLRELGLVTRKKYGRVYFYFPPKATKPKSK